MLQTLLSKDMHQTASKDDVLVWEQQHQNARLRHALVAGFCTYSEGAECAEKPESNTWCISAVRSVAYRQASFLPSAYSMSAMDS